MVKSIHEYLKVQYLASPNTTEKDMLGIGQIQRRVGRFVKMTTTSKSPKSSSMIVLKQTNHLEWKDLVDR